MEVTANIIPLIDITIKVAVLSYQYIDKVKKAQFVIQKLLEELQILGKILGDLEKDAQDPESTVLQQFGSPIQSLTRRHQKLESNKQLNGINLWLKRFKWPFEEAENIQFLREIERFKTNLLLAMHE